MDKDFSKILTEKVGKELNNNNFYLVDSSSNYFIYHRKSDSTIEIVQIGKDKYETYITVSVSIVFLNVNKEQSNINYPVFNECTNGDLEKISVDDCREKYFLKGNFGNGFHYGNVYLALCYGIVGVKPNGTKPLGFRIKKYKSTTYNELCDLIIKRLQKAYLWLERKRKNVETVNDGNDSLLKRVIELTEFLSMNYENQCKKSSLPNDMIANDLANDWDWITGLAKELYSNNQISLECLSMINLINDRFDEVSFGKSKFDKSIWCETGLKSHPFWTEQRKLALNLLTKLKAIE